MTNLAYAFLLLFIFTIPWEQLILIPGLGTGSRMVGVIAFPLGLLAIVKNGRFSLPWPIGLLAAFVALAALSLSWTYDIEGGFLSIQTYVQLLAMTWLVTQTIDGETKLHGVFMAYVLGSYVAAVGAIQAYMTGSYDAYLRYTAEGMGANDTALGLSVAIAMAGYLVVRRRGWMRLGALGFIPLGIYGVLLAASRAGFLAMLIALSLPFVLLLRPRHYAKAIALGLAGLVVGSVLLVRYVPESSWNRIATIQSEVSEGSLNGRLVIWSAGLRMINEAPVLGIGIGSFGDAMQRMVGWSKAPHNGVLSIAAQHGVVGLLIVVAAWVLVVRGVLSMPSLERRAWIMILAVLLMAVMSINWEWHKTTWLLLAMAVVHARHFEHVRRLAEAPAPQPAALGRAQGGRMPALTRRMESRAATP